jgi:FtsH-binding integral membrane protein
VNDTISSDRSDSQRVRGRALLLLGVGLVVLGVFAYVAQIALQRLTTPWYMPALATLGVLLVMISLRERLTFWRVFTLISVALLAAGEWGMLYALRLPRYTGPITLGRPFPPFETSRADGATFSQSDLVGSRNNALIFFRGRW